MYVGHFAAGLAIKAKVPEAPTWGLLAGVGVLDILFGPLVLAGVEQVSLTPDVSPGFRLDYIDWSHSLATSLLWSVLFGLAFLKLGRKIALAIGIAVFSHFVLDVLMHPPDLALWPRSSMHLGLGLWTALPTGWWFVELAFVAAAFLYYWRRSIAHPTFCGHPIGMAAALVVLHLFNSPWLSMT